jgi:hypothetical protein
MNLIKEMLKYLGTFFIAHITRTTIIVILIGIVCLIARTGFVAFPEPFCAKVKRSPRYVWNSMMNTIRRYRGAMIVADLTVLIIFVSVVGKSVCNPHEDIKLDSFINPHGPDSLKKQLVVTRIVSFDPSKHNPASILEHNKKIISLLQEGESTSAPQVIEDQSNLTQSRYLYLVLLVALGGILFRKKKIKRWPAVILTILIPLWLYLDVHLMFQYEWRILHIQIVGRALDTLVKSYPDSLHWENLDFSRSDTTFSNYFRISHRSLKINMALDPDLAQIAYFYVPWIFVYFLATRKKPKQFH